MAYKLLLAIAGVMLTVTSVSAATFTQFSDRASFETAANSLTTETFNSFVSDVTLSGASVDVGPFTIDGTSLTGISFLESDGTNPFNIDGSAFIRGIGETGAMDFIFDTPVTAFGADLFAINDVIERTQVDIGTETFLMAVLVSNMDSFFGVISDMPFTTVSFRVVAGEDAGIDNVSFAPVPLPAAFPLFAGGLGLLGLLGWRRKRTAAAAA